MISRRDFVANVAATTAAVTIVPRHVLGRGFVPPSDRLNIAGVGVGGQGRINLLNTAVGNNIVAMCDVDWGYAGRAWDSADADLKREQERLLQTDLNETASKNSAVRVAEHTDELAYACRNFTPLAARPSILGVRYSRRPSQERSA